MERVQLPQPPDSMADDFPAAPFAPDGSLYKFVQSAIVDEDGELYNVDHGHLAAAAIGFLWTTRPNKRNMRTVAGEAEIPNFKGGAWSRARQEFQFNEWFGDVPDFVITLSAPYWFAVDDVARLALLEHELYHCGQAVDEFGFPKFKRDGRPVFGIRGHDVEEFSGVVRRYGIEAAGANAVDLVRLAEQIPEVEAVRIAAVCGSC